MPDTSEKAPRDMIYKGVVALAHYHSTIRNLTTMQVPPERAIYSGYSMGYEYFQKLVLALRPAFAVRLQHSPQPYTSYILRYDSWRRALPKEDYEKAPLLKGKSKNTEARS
jgi:hypothetical protein